MSWGSGSAVLPSSNNRKSTLVLSSFSSSLLGTEETKAVTRSIKTIKEESIKNFYIAQRDIQDSFPQVISNYLTKEQAYQFKLAQLKRVFNHVVTNLKKKTAETQAVTLCILSSVKFMISISREVQELLEMLSEIDTISLLHWKPSKEIVSAVDDIESFVSIYELFCNNPRGYSHPAVLFLFTETIPIKNEGEKCMEQVAYPTLIESVYEALLRYTNIVKTLIELDGTGEESLLYHSCKEIAAINAHVQESKAEFDSFVLSVAETAAWRDFPKETDSLNILRFDNPILHRGLVSVQRKETKQEAILYLFAEMLIMCTAEEKQFIRHLPLPLVSWSDTGPQSFDIIFIEGSIKKTYNVTCSSNDEKEEWLKQKEILSVLNEEMDDASESTEDKTSYLDIYTGEWNHQLILSEMIEAEEGILRSATVRLKNYKSCFSGHSAVVWLTKKITQSKEESIKIGQQWMKLDLIEPISKRETFSDKKQSLYHLKFAKCLNCMCLYWPKPARKAVEVSIDLLSQVVRIFQDNRVMVSKYKIEGMNLMSLDPSYYEFQCNTAELQRVNLDDLDEQEKFVFFCNVYNTLALHSYIAQHNNISSKGLSDLNCIGFLSKNKYNIAGYSFSLYQIDHAILRANLSLPEVFLSSKIIPKFKPSDPRYKYTLKGNKLVNFILSVGAVESPPVIILRPEILEQQIKEHIELFCERKVHVFIQGDKWKIRLPKILQWFNRDFGTTYRDVVMFLLPYLPARIQETLSFLENPSEHISIRFDEFNWDFCYSISPQEESRNKKTLISQEKLNRVVSDVQQYNWFLSRDKSSEEMNQILIEDILTESQFAFSIPYQILHYVLPLRQRYLDELPISSPYTNMCQEHISMLTIACSTYEKQFMKTARYQGLSFRPSPYKNDPVLSCVPTNLHNHVTICQDPQNKSHYFAHSTLGAPAAHVYKFKNGGIRQLEEEKRSMNLNFKSSPLKKEEIELQITHRLDICICQVITAIIDILDTQMQWHPDISSLFRQFEFCGILVHFESLLSTISAEAGMLGDMDFAVRFINNRLVINFSELEANNFLNPEVHQILDPYEAIHGIGKLDDKEKFVVKWGLPKKLFNKLPSTLQDSQSVPVFCAITTQGINEQQTIAIYRKSTKLQEDINKEHLQVIEVYFRRFLELMENEKRNNQTEVQRMEENFNIVQQIIHSSTNEKNIEILPLVADFVRGMNGLRCTSCKSAKDRTSMAVSWEQGRWIKRICPSMDNEKELVKEIRLNGVRKRNAFKNIGKQKFAFNDFQRKCLPGPYRAPRSITSNYTIS